MDENLTPKLVPDKRHFFEPHEVVQSVETLERRLKIVEEIMPRILDNPGYINLKAWLLNFTWLESHPCHFDERDRNGDKIQALYDSLINLIERENPGLIQDRILPRQFKTLRIIEGKIQAKLNALQVKGATRAAAEAIIFGALPGRLMAIKTQYVSAVRQEIYDAMHSILSEIGEEKLMDTLLEDYGMPALIELMSQTTAEIEELFGEESSVAQVLSYVREELDSRTDQRTGNNDRIKRLLPISLLDPEEPKKGPRLRLAQPPSYSQSG